jgi:hypothetical protein
MKSFLPVTLALLVFAGLGRAQTTPPPVGTWGPEAGSREITLGGAGAANQDMDDSYGGVNFSVGIFTTPQIEWSVRQSILYANPSPGGNEWNGSTRVAFDFHLAGRERLRPFIGANIGGVYGESITDTFAAGLEAGLKHYVQPRTFIYAMAEYAWFFTRTSRLDNNFRDGQFNWSVGLGFNF